MTFVGNLQPGDWLVIRRGSEGVVDEVRGVGRSRDEAEALVRQRGIRPAVIVRVVIAREVQV